MLDATMLQIGSRRQFFFDDLVIESTQDLTRRFHTPNRHPQSPLLRRDQPWEKLVYLTCNTWNVIRDPQDCLFKCWYENWLVDDPRAAPSFIRSLDGKLAVNCHGAAPSSSCYAFSEDGIGWKKPSLGLYSHAGTDTNTVLGNGVLGEHAHCAYVFLDPLESEGSRRYKTMFEYRAQDNGEGSIGAGMFSVAASPDGIHWEMLPERPTFGGAMAHLGDVVTLSVDPDGHLYWVNNRHPGMCQVPLSPVHAATQSWISPYAPNSFEAMNKRRIFRSVSSDLVHWSAPWPLVVPDDGVDNLDDAFYGLEQFQIGDDWLGLLNVLHMTDNTMDVQLVYSRNGTDFTRIKPGQPWLPRGPSGEWDETVVTLCSKPFRVGDELYVYYAGARNHHDWWMVGVQEGLDVPEAGNLDQVDYGIGLATIGFERFVSLDTGPVREGVLVTRALRTTGEHLHINAACRNGGSNTSSIAAELTDAVGTPIPGFTKQECIPFRSDRVEHRFKWRSGKSIPSGGFLRVRFFLQQAEIFSFQFVE